MRFYVPNSKLGSFEYWAIMAAILDWSPKQCVVISRFGWGMFLWWSNLNSSMLGLWEEGSGGGEVRLESLNC